VSPAFRSAPGHALRHRLHQLLVGQKFIEALQGWLDQSFHQLLERADYGLKQVALTMRVRDHRRRRFFFSSPRR
jgi:hypothetical protein